MKVGIFAISGFNNRAVIALCRWATARNIAVHLAAESKRDSIYRTVYKQKVFLERTHSSLTVDELCQWIQLLKEMHAYEKVFIAPSTEFFNRFLLEHRDPIERIGGIIPLVSQELYTKVSDKYTFGELCSDYGISIPRELQLPIRSFPAVAKPRTYAPNGRGQIKPYLVYSEEDWKTLVATQRLEDFYFQEFVHGKSVYLLAHVSKMGKATVCAQENLIQQARGGSIILARHHGFHKHPTAQAYLRMLCDIGFHGLIMIEVRLCEESGQCLMIEANPRMWGPLQFVIDRSTDLLGAWFADYGFTIEPVKGCGAEQEYYFWSGGLSVSSQPYAWHNYTATDFVSDYKKLAEADLFCREDTLDLYRHELSE